MVAWSKLIAVVYIQPWTSSRSGSSETLKRSVISCLELVRPPGSHFVIVKIVAVALLIFCEGRVEGRRMVGDYSAVDR